MSRIKRAGIQVPTPHLQGYGIHEVPMDLYGIEEQLQKHDKFLFLAFIPELQRVAIMRYQPGLNSEPHMITVCQEKDGSYRIPDQRDVDEIRYGDLWQNDNLSYANYRKAQETKAESQKRSFDNMAEEMGRDMAHMAAIAGEIHSPRVSMHVSKREKKEK